METDELLKILACPACKSDLTIKSKGKKLGFACENCQVVYPVVDEIPIMLIEEAIPFNEWQGENQ